MKYIVFIYSYCWLYIYIYIYIYIYTHNTIFVRYVDNNINVILICIYIYIYILYIYINFNFAKSFINFNPDVGLSKIIQTKPNQNSLYIQNFAENLGLYRDYRKLAQLGFKSTSTISSLWRHCNILRYKVMSFTCTRFCRSSIFTLAQRFL